MRQMSPIYWLMLMMYFIVMIMILIMSVQFFLKFTSKEFMLTKFNNSMNWMW